MCSIRIINQVHNERYSRTTLKNLLACLSGHPQDTIAACGNFLWICGRCFCHEPLMRVFDRFRRVDLVHLPSVLEE